MTASVLSAECSMKELALCVYVTKSTGLPLFDQKGKLVGRNGATQARRICVRDFSLECAPFSFLSLFPFQQMAACTCNCSTSANNSAAASGVNVGQEQHLLSPSSLSSSPANSGHVRSLESRTDHRETSAASSHYFSPVSSFSNNSGAGVHNSHHHHDDSGSSNKDPDSLEYKYGQSYNLSKSNWTCVVTFFLFDLYFFIYCS